MMYVPRGFAHGFISLRTYSEVIYLVSDFYSPKSEETLLWNDPDISINWPIKPVIISDKDNQGKYFKDIKSFK